MATLTGSPKEASRRRRSDRCALAYPLSTHRNSAALCSYDLSRPRHSGHAARRPAQPGGGGSSGGAWSRRRWLPPRKSAVAQSQSSHVSRASKSLRAPGAALGSPPQPRELDNASPNLAASQASSMSFYDGGTNPYRLEVGCLLPCRIQRRRCSPAFFCLPCATDPSCPVCSTPSRMRPTAWALARAGFAR